MNKYLKYNDECGKPLGYALENKILMSKETFKGFIGNVKFDSVEFKVMSDFIESGKKWICMDYTNGFKYAFLNM